MMLFIYDDNFLNEFEIKTMEDLIDNHNDQWKYNNTLPEDRDVAWIINIPGFDEVYYFTIDPTPEQYCWQPVENIIKKFIGEKNTDFVY